MEFSNSNSYFIRKSHKFNILGLIYFLLQLTMRKVTKEVLVMTTTLAVPLISMKTAT